MEVHEQVYTSARELLGSSQGDLGVVAESVGFPQQLDSDLHAVCSYRLLESMPTENSSLHPPRFVLSTRGANNEYFSISRIVFAGADHTGRTTPLAHHVIFRCDQLNSSGNSLADIFYALKPFFFSKWQEAPKRFDPPRQLNDLNQIGCDSQFPNPLWFSFAERAEVARLFGMVASQITNTSLDNNIPIILVLPDNIGERIVDLIRDLLAVLPTSFQFKMGLQTHVVNSSDVVGFCNVMFTYPGTQFLEQAQSRSGKFKPVVYDLVSSEFPKQENYDYGLWVETQINRSHPFSQIKAGVNLREEIGEIKQADCSPFMVAESLRCALLSSDPFANYDQLTEMIAKLCATSQRAEDLAVDLISSTIQQYFTNNQTPADWRILASITQNKHWPKKIRQLVARGLEKFPQRSYPFYFEAIGLSESSPDKMRDHFRSVCESHPEIITSIINQAGKSQDSASLKAVDRVFRVLLPKAELSQIHEWLKRINLAPHEPRDRMTESFIFYLCQSVKSGSSSIASIKKIFSEFHDHRLSSMSRLVFEILEKASSDRKNLSDEIEWANQILREKGGSFHEYDYSGHSNELQNQIREIITESSTEPSQAENPSAYGLKSGEINSRYIKDKTAKSPRKSFNKKNISSTPYIRPGNQKSGLVGVLYKSMIAEFVTAICVVACWWLIKPDYDWWIFNPQNDGKVRSLVLGAMIISCIIACVSYCIVKLTKDIKNQPRSIKLLKSSIGLIWLSIGGAILVLALRLG